MAEAAAMVSNTLFVAAAVVAIAVAAVEMVLDGEIITVFRIRIPQGSSLISIVCVIFQRGRWIEYRCVYGKGANAAQNESNGRRPCNAVRARRKNQKSVSLLRKAQSPQGYMPVVVPCRFHRVNVLK